MCSAPTTCWRPRARPASGGAIGVWAYIAMRDVPQAFRLALHAPLSDPPALRSFYLSAADTIADEPSAELVERFYPRHRHFAERLPGHTSFFSWAAAHL